MDLSQIYKSLLESREGFPPELRDLAPEHAVSFVYPNKAIDLTLTLANGRAGGQFA
jgi:hypothetical protein